MVVFDDEIVSHYREISNDLIKSRNDIKNKLVESRNIDAETRILLEFLSWDSLAMLSLLFKHSTVFMQVLNDHSFTATRFEKFVDSLPTEFHIQKQQWKKDIAGPKANTELEVQTLRERLLGLDDITDFIRWEKRYREDEVKDKEGPCLMNNLTLGKRFSQNGNEFAV